MITRDKLQDTLFWYLSDVLPTHVLLIATFFIGVYIGAPEVCP